MPYGFKFNGIYSVDKNLVVMHVAPSVLPPLTTVAQQVPRRPGAYYYRSDYGMRQIPVDVAYIGSSLADARAKVRDIANWLQASSSPQALVFDDETDKTYYAVLDGTTDWQQLVYFGKTTLNFTCPDPLAYGTETSAAFANGSVAVTPAGTYETYPRIQCTFTQQVSNPSLTDSVTGSKITVDHVFAANDTLTIDCSKEYIEINGANAMADLDLTSDFFGMNPGVAHTLTLSDTTITATAYWTPRWL